MRYLIPVYILAALIAAFLVATNSFAQVTFSGGAGMEGGAKVPEAAAGGAEATWIDTFEGDSDGWTGYDTASCNPIGDPNTGIGIDKQGTCNYDGLESEGQQPSDEDQWV